MGQAKRNSSIVTNSLKVHIFGFIFTIIVPMSGQRVNLETRCKTSYSGNGGHDGELALSLIDQSQHTLSFLVSASTLCWSRSSCLGFLRNTFSYNGRLHARYEIL